MADKARLAQENARLIRENLGLQVRHFTVVDEASPSLAARWV